MKGQKQKEQLKTKNFVIFLAKIVDSCFSILYESKQKLLIAIESNKLHIFDSQMCIDKPIKIISETKTISYAVLDNYSRLWVACDKNVSDFLRKNNTM